jgi:hypothetical protein
LLIDEARAHRILPGVKRACRIVLLLPLCGCLSVASLEHSSMKHERRANYLSQVGNGPAAAREANQAASDQEAARRTAEKRDSYWESEVLLQ